MAEALIHDCINAAAATSRLGAAMEEIEAFLDGYRVGGGAPDTILRTPGKKGGETALRLLSAYHRIVKDAVTNTSTWAITPDRTAALVDALNSEWDGRAGFDDRGTIRDMLYRPDSEATRCSTTEQASISSASVADNPSAFVLIETADIEIVNVRLFISRDAALETFETIAAENHVHAAPRSDLKHEIGGTIALAGDDAYAVQVVEVPSPRLVTDQQLAAPVRLLQGARRP